MHVHAHLHGTINSTFKLTLKDSHIHREKERERERERDSHSSMPFCFEHSFEFNTAHCFIRNDLLTEGITVALDRLTCEISGQQKKIVTQSYEPLNELLNFR